MRAEATSGSLVSMSHLHRRLGLRMHEDGVRALVQPAARRPRALASPRMNHRGTLRLQAPPASLLLIEPLASCDTCGYTNSTLYLNFPRQGFDNYVITLHSVVTESNKKPLKPSSVQPVRP